MCVLAFGAMAESHEHNYPVENTNDIECSLCHFIADKVTEYLEQNKTETEIIHLLEKVCKLTGKWEDKCVSIIDIYGKTIIDEVLQLGDDKVCQLVGLCTNELVSVPSCKICEIVVAELESLLASQKTLEQIITELSHICDIFTTESKKIGTICKIVVYKYTPKLIELLEKGVDNACEYLHICNDNDNMMYDKSNELDKCTLCKITVGEVYHLLEIGEVKEDILKVLDGMCLIFPKEDEQKECDDFINMFAEMIINFLEHDEDPTTLCDQLNLCM